MTNFGLGAFAAMAVFLILVPSPLFRLTGSFLLQRGRGVALATIPGLLFGLCGAAAFAAAPVMLIAETSPSIIDMVAFAGPWYLLAYVVVSYLDPQRRRPMADNDNLPERRSLRIAAHVMKQALQSPRYALAFLAILIQLWEPTLPALDQFLWMELACAAAIAAAATLQALVPRRFLNRRRPTIWGKTASRKAPKIFIARRAVTAGYRRIAA